MQCCCCCYIISPHKWNYWAYWIGTTWIVVEEDYCLKFIPKSYIVCMYACMHVCIYLLSQWFSGHGCYPMLTKIATIASSSNCDCFDLLVRIICTWKTVCVSLHVKCVRGTNKISFASTFAIFFNFEFKTQPFLTTQSNHCKRCFLLLTFNTFEVQS